MDNSKYTIDQMISAKSIAARVEALAYEITKFYKGTDKLVVVGLLRGSFVFIADLAREIDLPVEIDFLEASSYGNKMESSREVRILKDLNDEISGKDVLVVEDIVDTGHTLHHVLTPCVSILAYLTILWTPGFSNFAYLTAILTPGLSKLAYLTALLTLEIHMSREWRQR